MPTMLAFNLQKKSHFKAINKVEFFHTLSYKHYISDLL